MMTIALYITLWLLSGFLAAWLSHTLIHEREYDMPNDVVGAALLLGPIILAIVLCTHIGNVIKSAKPLFKAKEPE